MMEFKQVINHVSDQEIIDMAAALVRIPSYSGMKDQEKAVAHHIAARFEAEGIQTELVEVLPGRPNVIARLPGCGTGQSLMLTGHMDTVPPYEMKGDPFSGTIHENRLHGRGACDMKSALAAMMGALIALKRSGVQLAGDLVFAGVINEEQLNEGTEYIVRNGPHTDAAIIGEPTELKIAPGHRGLEWIKIQFKGKTTHGGTPTEGVNAISKAAKFINLVEEKLVPTFSRYRHPLIGEPLLNFGVITGGDQPSSVAGRCSLSIDRRWTPLESYEKIYDELHQLVNELRKKDNEFEAEIERYFKNSDMMLHRPLETDLNHPLLSVLQQGIKDVLKTTPETIAFPAWTDASLLSNYAGITSVVLGPGHLKEAHNDNESISLMQIVEAYKLYTYTAIHYCDQEQNHEE